MNKVLIKNLSQFEGQEVNVSGWVFNLRSSGKIMFLQMRDGSGFTQAILVKDEATDELWEHAQKITQESSVELIGVVSKHPKKDEYELQVKDLKILQIAPEYPISNKDHGTDFLLENRHLWLRSKKQWAIQCVRNTVISAIYEFFYERDFIKIDSPILTPNACEGTTTLFKVPYFDQGDAYLSQSGQLYLEALIVSHGRVFDFGPVFRAEKSKTRRHLTEFWMMDAEMAFVEHEENMQMQEDLIKFIFQKVLAKNYKELEILERDTGYLQKIVDSEFKRMTHKQAVEYLQTKGSQITDGDDLGGEDETLLTQEFDVPVFVEKWPAKIKAFYMKKDPENSDLVLGSDLISTEGFGEISGGAQREDDYDTLLQSIKAHDLSEEDFQWYLDLRKYGSVPHSGFGIGLERTVAWVCGVKHVRETIPFPRTIYRLKP